MLISIKLAIIPFISIAIMTSFGIFIYNVFSKKRSRTSVLVAGLAFLLLFGLLVMMNLKNEKGEYVWKRVNQGEYNNPN